MARMNRVKVSHGCELNQVCVYFKWYCLRLNCYLGSEVTNRQLREDDLRARLDALVKLLVDDLPLGVDDGLVVSGVRDAHLSVLFLRLELELNVEDQDLRRCFTVVRRRGG